MTTLTDLKKGRLLPGPAVRNVVVISGTLRAVTPVHVGSGGTRKAIKDDLPLKRMLVEPGSWTDPDADRAPHEPCRPYLPGTSVRGVLRGWCEAMLAPFGVGVASLQKRDPERAEREVARPDDDGVAAVHADDAAAAGRLRDELDLISGLWGSTRWRGKIEVRAARLEAGTTLKPGIIKRVALDPDLGAAEHGKLFSVEYAPPGTTFELTLVARNVVRWELGLLLHALDSFNHDAFATRVGALGGHDWGRVTWSPTRVERLGQVPVDGAKVEGNVLKDWIDAQRAGKQAHEIDAGERKRLREEATSALTEALKILGGG